MSDTAYSVVATILKYWFLLLICFIFFRMAQMLFSEFREVRRNKRDAYYAYSGYLEACQSADSHFEGARFPFRRTSYIGRSSRCDIRLKTRSLSPVEFVLYQHGRYFYVGNVNSKYGILLDGAALEQEDMPLRDGAIIETEGFVFQVHFMQEKNV